MEIPTNFQEMITNMTEDLINTFPEHSEILSHWTGDGFRKLDSEELSSKKISYLYDYSLKIYPERFFDIIYQNEKMFDDDSVDTCFLPEVDFKILFCSNGISDNTRKTMWNYLKLILLTIVGSVKDKSTFGSTNALFHDMDEEKLLSTLTETMSSMSDFFQEMENKEMSDIKENVTPECKMPEKNAYDIPNVDDIFGHLKGLFDGKIGSLVKELAEEISENLADVLGEGDMNDVRSTKDVIEKLMKNPKKVTDLCA